jgi:hypothetical protein
VKRVFAVILALAALSLSAVAPAHAAFGFKSAEVTFTDEGGAPVSQAGSHPFAMTTSVAFNTVFDPDLGEGGADVPEDAVRDVKVDLPPGLVADRSAVPSCTGLEFAEFSCPDSSAVGVIAVVLNKETIHEPVYNLAPPPGVLGKLGFSVVGAPVTIELGVSEQPPYHGTARLTGISQIAKVYSSELTIWGDPADDSHDAERGRCLESGKSCPFSAAAAARPFLTLPRSCSGPLTTVFEADSWQNPGTWTRKEVETHDAAEPSRGTVGCEKLGFDVGFGLRPTTTSAESPTGLDAAVDVDDKGLLDPAKTAQSDIQKTVVALPEGMTINPSQAEGLGACSEQDLARETFDSFFGAGCPPSSKIGTAEVETPLLEGEVLKGSLFVAKPYENRFGSLVALYMTIKDPTAGVSVSLAGKVEPNPRSGRLVTTFDDLPQLPFSHFRLHFRDGGRSPLVSPPRCGAHTSEARFYPWANPGTAAPLMVTSTFPISSGPGGAPCPPAGAPPFAPGFEAGSTDNTARAFSPFYMRLTRRDGDQEMTRFSAALPPGVSGKIAGVGKCPDAAIAAARGRTGLAERAAPSCPSSSQIGRVLAGAGVGPDLTYVPGKLYLAGPFGGDPLSIAAVVPAVAGPFDLGTVVTRVPLTVNPESGEVEVDAAGSDPIPHILQGIPLKLRDLRIYADRPNFTLNATSCDPSQARATIFGSFLDMFSTADDVPASVAARYQAAGCSRLGFKPKLSFRLKGGTKRGMHPAFRAIVRPRPGDANIGRAVVTLPHSAFLDQSHIRTVCTRVQFRAQQCPAGSIYGHALATSPLLDEPLSGPVYLRSSDHPLPDLVFALRGIVEVDVATRIDSTRGRLRATLGSIPDLPVSKFVLEMQGKRKGLIVNSRNLCAHRAKAVANLTGHNGKPYRLRPSVRVSCGRKSKHHKG